VLTDLSDLSDDAEAFEATTKALKDVFRAGIENPIVKALESFPLGRRVKKAAETRKDKFSAISDKCKEFKENFEKLGTCFCSPDEELASDGSKSIAVLESVIASGTALGMDLHYVRAKELVGPSFLQVFQNLVACWCRFVARGHCDDPVVPLPWLDKAFQLFDTLGGNLGSLVPEDDLDGIKLAVAERLKYQETADAFATSSRLSPSSASKLLKSLNSFSMSEKLTHGMGEGAAKLQTWFSSAVISNKIANLKDIAMGDAKSKMEELGKGLAAVFVNGCINLDSEETEYWTSTSTHAAGVDMALITSLQDAATSCGQQLLIDQLTIIGQALRLVVPLAKVIVTLVLPQSKDEKRIDGARQKLVSDLRSACKCFLEVVRGTPDVMINSTFGKDDAKVGTGDSWRYTCSSENKHARFGICLGNRCVSRRVSKHRFDIHGCKHVWNKSRGLVVDLLPAPCLSVFATFFVFGNVPHSNMSVARTCFERLCLPSNIDLSRVAFLSTLRGSWAKLSTRPPC
jgi:hypothetical protein